MGALSMILGDFGWRIIKLNLEKRPVLRFDLCPSLPSVAKEVRQHRERRITTAYLKPNYKDLYGNLL